MYHEDKTIISKEDLTDNVVERKRRSKVVDPKRAYIRWLAFFLAGFIIIIFSPFFTGENYNIQANEIGDVQMLSSELPIELINKEWNSDTGLLKVEFELLKEVGDSNLTNIDIEEVFVAHVSDPDEKITTELIKVKPNYFVLLADGLTEKFNIVGVGLKPTYINPKIERENDVLVMENTTIQYFFYEDEMKINSKLKKEKIDSYQVDLINYREKQLKDEIKEKENEIELSKVRIENYHLTIDELDFNNLFLTEEEVEDLEKKLIDLERKIFEEEERIVLLEEEIETFEERIILYEMEKDTINNEK